MDLETLIGWNTIWPSNDRTRFANWTGRIKAYNAGLTSKNPAHEATRRPA